MQARLPSGSFSSFLRCLTPTPGVVVPLYAESEDPISRLQEMLAASTGVPAHKLELRHNNNPLTQSLRDHGVPYGDPVDVLIMPVLNVRLPTGEK